MMSLAETANWVCSPPPCGEGLGVGVMREVPPSNIATPLPNPPPQGGRERTEFVVRSSINLTNERRF